VKTNSAPKKNIGSTDTFGVKQSPNRKADNPMKLASATPQFHNARNGHKPSARDPMKVFGRIARGHISAETVLKTRLPAARAQRLTEMKEHLDEMYAPPRVNTRDRVMTEVEDVEKYVKNMFEGLKEIKKKTK
jgi:hypothetical protein